MFKIYNASAGSGKTYALVKEYLSIVLGSKVYLPHRHVLAITFTNKAVDEMKQRIVAALMRFSNPEILTTPDTLFSDLISTLKITPEALHQKSTELIQKILHNYGSFEVSTIDKFNQKLIRTFAYDLKLPLNFEVELDTDILLQKAVDNLISKVGQNNELTKVLIDYAVMKLDDDKSWDIALDLNKFAKLLTKEPAIPFLKAISKTNLKTYVQFKSKIEASSISLEDKIVQTSEAILNDIKTEGIDFSDFSGSYVPKYFSALASQNFNVSLNNAWQKNIETSNLYPQKASDISKAKIDALQPKIVEAFQSTKAAIYQLKYLNNIIKNITPISVLTLIQKELDFIKKEQNLLMISEFNAIIANAIRNQPAPFIYERIGEKFNHHFIDEFQDTSELQWQNLTPLLINALSSGGSALLVGDAKQAIYRWRGGNPEQFIELVNNISSFPIKADVANLPKNYRSCKQIVTFNNALFHYISSHLFSDKQHQKLYRASSQTTHIGKEGYVQLSFIDFQQDDDKSELYAEYVYQTIQSIIASDPNISYSDICVLVRKRKEGVSVANYLISKELRVVSNETLMVSGSPEVQFVIHVLKYLQTASDAESKLNIINYLIKKHNVLEAHQFRLNLLSLNTTAFFATLYPLGIDFNPNTILDHSIYDSVEGIIRSFNLVKSSDAYIHFFLDFVFEFSQKEDNSILQFLEYYEQHKDSLSIRSPKQIDAVQILTIHKSKGLEFPIVIVPFADLNIYKEIEPKEWMPTGHLDPNIPYILMNFNKDFEHFGAQGLARYNEHLSKLELDNINLLYVALTRAEQQLYIVGDSSGGVKPADNLKTFSDLLIHFLYEGKKWNPNITTYHFGTQERIDSKEESTHPTVFQKTFVSSTKPQSKMGLVVKANHFWSDQQKEAIERGNLLHLLLSKVVHENDVQEAVDNIILEGHIDPSQANPLIDTLKSIVGHPRINTYFSGKFEIYNEREIINEKGQIVIPDRLVIKPDGNAIIIDYKTGEHHDHYFQQLDTYSNIVEKMGYKVLDKMLVYIYPTLEIKSYN